MPKKVYTVSKKVWKKNYIFQKLHSINLRGQRENECPYFCHRLSRLLVGGDFRERSRDLPLNYLKDK